MLRTDRRPVETEESSALEYSVDDGVCEIVVVKDIAPAFRMLVRGEDHRTTTDVAGVDDVVEDVRGVVAVREVANLVDDEDVRLHVLCKCLTKLAFAAGGRQFFDELGCGCDARGEAVPPGST